jgi:hypothetical protein
MCACIYYAQTCMCKGLVQYRPRPMYNTRFVSKLPALACILKPELLDNCKLHGLLFTTKFMDMFPILNLTSRGYMRISIFWQSDAKPIICLFRFLATRYIVQYDYIKKYMCIHVTVHVHM